MSHPLSEREGSQAINMSQPKLSIQGWGREGSREVVTMSLSEIFYMAYDVYHNVYDVYVDVHEHNVDEFHVMLNTLFP